MKDMGHTRKFMAMEIGMLCLKLLRLVEGSLIEHLRPRPLKEAIRKVQNRGYFKKSCKDTLPNPLITEYEKRNKRNTIAYSLQPVSNANLKWRDLPSVERHAYCEKLSKLQERSFVVLEFFLTLYFDKDVDRNNLMKEKCICNQGGSYGLGGDDYFTSAMPDFGVSTTGNEVGSSSRGDGFNDDDDMDE
ncbi:hypothetical protein Tco_0295001 [Tanacetum coccineum]